MRIRVDWTERGDANRGDWRAGPEEFDRTGNRLFRRGGRKLGDLRILGTAAYGAQELGSSGLDSSETWHELSVRCTGGLRRSDGGAEFDGGFEQPATIRLPMRLFKFARVLALCGFAAAAIAQQPSASSPAATPPKAGTSGTAAPGTPAPPGILAPAAPESNVPPDTVVLTIGNQTLTRAQFEVLLSALAQNGRPAATAAQKRQVAEQYGELEVMAQEARKRKLDDSPEVKQMMAIQSDSFLANTLAKRISDETHFTELDLRAYYDSHKNEFEEAQGSHILIRFKGSSVPLKKDEKDLTEEEALAKAQDIRKQLLAGADFATLAKAESDDTGSAAKGGDLGTFRHGQMVPAFDQAAFSIAVGEVSEPVKTQFGYHIIKIKSRDAKPFETAKAQIEKDLKPKMTKDALELVKTQTRVTLNDSYFGPSGNTGPQTLPVPPAK